MIAPIARAKTIPSSWYFDPAHHALEIEKVFAATWQQVAREEELPEPGSWVAAEVAGEPLLVVRGRDRKLRAFYNVCRHRAGTVARGERGCHKAFRCTYHGWTYALDGKLLATPEMDGVERFDREDFGLVPVACDTWAGLVFVNLAKRPGKLASALGDLPKLAERTAFSSMRFGRRDVYTIPCNWKVYVDNYLEGYHIPYAHPELNKVLDYKRYEVETSGPIVVQSSPAKGEARADERYLYVWVWPSFMLNVSPEYAQVNLIVPDGPETTRCVFDYFFVPGEDGSRSIAWSDAIQQEDIDLCTSVQRNLRSRSYVAGRYSVKRENGLYAFHRMLRERLSVRGGSARAGRRRGSG